MRRHPTYIHEPLWSVDFPRPAVDVSYAHHENWDGSGYPRGLKGEAIPLAARIFAVVDTWDALRSNRPYRPAWSGDRVVDYLRERAGRDFDPTVVAVFLRMIDEVDGREPETPEPSDQPSRRTFFEGPVSTRRFTIVRSILNASALG